MDSKAEIVVLATSSALTAIFYSIYKSRTTTVTRLKEAKKVSLDQDLKTLLSETPGRCVPYAVIEGAVRAKETLSSQFVDNCKGVIERLTLKEEKMVWNRTTHLWNSKEKVIHQRTNTVPFSLGPHDEDISTSVRVIRPLDAAELNLETTYKNFHPTVRSFSNIIGHFISGEQTKGIEETEEMLRLGDSVTGVGELVLDNNTIRLQPPKQQGFCYFLTRLDYESLLRKQEGNVRLWRVLTVLFGVAACSTLFYILWRSYMRHRKRKEERRILEEFKEQQKKRMRELDVDESSVSPSSCTVCLSRERACVFLECGHVCACAQCYEALPLPKTCPICRAAIDRVVPLYNS
ncbi:unnamed protein product [Ophioblennius macclurei]